MDASLQIFIILQGYMSSLVTSTGSEVKFARKRLLLPRNIDSPREVEWVLIKG